MPQGIHRVHSLESASSSDSTKIDSSEISDRAYALWFVDGNVVLAAQDTYFRVHQGVLSLNSSIFGSILEDVEHSQAQLDKLGICRNKRVAGGTVLRLSDSAHDFEHLLRIFYQGFE